MLEQTCAPLRAERLQREILVAPVKNEPTQIIYLKAHKIEALVLGAEASDHEATERNLVFGLLVFANRRAEANAREAKRKAQRETKDARAAIDLTMWKEGEFTSSNLLKSVDDDHRYRVTEQKGLGIKRKFIIYSSVITLLVGAYYLLISTLL